MNKRITALPLREQRGSRPRCLILTEGSPTKVAQRLTELVQPYAIINPDDLWLPQGFTQPDEAKLGETSGLLTPEQQEVVTTWWLAHRQRANTPNWDIAVTATIDGRRGLVLVEAKAYDRELDPRGKSGLGNPDNHVRIGNAIKTANAGLNSVLPGWDLTVDSHYQLANRFAWSWKLTSVGIPVILVYLGFLKAEEMSNRGRPFADHDAWCAYMVQYSQDSVPVACWEQPLDNHGTILLPVMRTAQVNLD